MTVRIQGKDYVTVPERVAEFHKKYKTGSIKTEVLRHNPVVVQATVWPAEGSQRIFTGISYANPNKQIEKMSPYEVAETSAVGRALGFLGLGSVDSIATADELVKATFMETQPNGVAATTRSGWAIKQTKGTKGMSQEELKEFKLQQIFKQGKKAKVQDLETAIAWLGGEGSQYAEEYLAGLQLNLEEIKNGTTGE